ncbi:hypothetical protein NIES4075_04090 [Tolypothrix sp. NIES-4075]|nr:hypothetical protein NIES4075_04090 [Tolypothrix sp. NIES-4075]
MFKACFQTPVVNNANRFVMNAEVVVMKTSPVITNANRFVMNAEVVVMKVQAVVTNAFCCGYL